MNNLQKIIDKLKEIFKDYIFYKRDIKDIQSKYNFSKTTIEIKEQINEYKAIFSDDIKKQFPIQIYNEETTLQRNRIKIIDDISSNKNIFYTIQIYINSKNKGILPQIQIQVPEGTEFQYIRNTNINKNTFLSNILYYIENSNNFIIFTIRKIKIKNRIIYLINYPAIN